MRWTLSLSASQRSHLVSPEGNPHPLAILLAGIYIFATYSRMMDDEIQDESLVLEDFEDDELAGDEKY